MSRLAVITSSTIGMKVLMAVTGVVMYGWVLAHMLGHLQTFAGAEVYDAYAAFLQNGPMLWPMRIVMGATIATHIWAAVALTNRSRLARPKGYKKTVFQASTLAARTMRVTGPLVLLFLIFHILHLTVGVFGDFEHGKAFSNLVTAMKNPVYTVIYIVATSMVGLHLHHGLWSLFQTLGLDSPRYRSVIRNGATLFTAIVVVGFIIVPIAILLGMVR